MHESDNPLDASLLRALVLLLEERSVTRVALKLGLSQPATSQMLKRLREIFKDQLLVRGQGGMVLTDRAASLKLGAESALEGLNNLLAGPGEFDPSVTQQTFTIALPDHVLPLKFNGLLREFRRQAPLARLVMRALGPDYDFEGALAVGAADLVISNWPKPPPYLRRSVLFEDRFVCLVDRSHPFASRTTTEQQYLAAGHIVPSDYSSAHRGVVETHLSSLRRERDRRLVVGYFSMAPYLLVGTDLVFTTTRHFAEHYASILPLTIIELPVKYPRIEFYQLWHERMQHSATHRWFRHLVASTCDGDHAGGGARAGESTVTKVPRR